MRKLTTEEFITKAKNVHGDKYDYSKVNYINNSTKVCIICHKHGDFWQTPANHLNNNGCPRCANKNVTTEDFITKATKIHGDKYDYSKVEYINNFTKVCIICSEHGEFWQTPNNHLSGKGCPKCAKKFMSTSYFIEKSNKIHNNRYCYDKVYFQHSKMTVDIICPIHGIFKQTPDNHLSGKGCPHCSSSKLETEVENELKTNCVEYISQKKFEWLGRQSLDFYIPSKNIAIECQGIQHFKPTKWFGIDEKYEERFKYVIELDKRKKELCEKNGIKLLYYSNLGIEYPYKVYEDISKLMTEIC